MRYACSLTIPANTLESEPYEETLGLPYGSIKQVFVLHPSGSIGLAHLQVFYQTRQIIPATPGESFVGNGTVRSFPDNIPIHEPPYGVVIRGWNLDDTYAHTVYVELTVLPEVVYVPTIIQAPMLPEGL